MLAIITATFPLDDNADARDALGNLGRLIHDAFDGSVTVETSIVDDEAYLGVSYLDDRDNLREVGSLAERRRAKVEQILIDENIDDIGIEPVTFV